MDYDPLQKQRDEHTRLGRKVALKEALIGGVLGATVAFVGAHFTASKNCEWNSFISFSLIIWLLILVIGTVGFQQRYKYWWTTMGFCALFALRFEQTGGLFAKNPPWTVHPTERFIVEEDFSKQSRKHHDEQNESRKEA